MCDITYLELKYYDIVTRWPASFLQISVWVFNFFTLYGAKYSKNPVLCLKFALFKVNIICDVYNFC